MTSCSVKRIKKRLGILVVTSSKYPKRINILRYLVFLGEAFAFKNAGAK